MAKKDKKEKGGAVYRVTDVIGTSDVSWEDAARSAIKTASKSLRDLRIAESDQARRQGREREADAVPHAGCPLSFKYGA